jgi:hypothetical protein
MRLHEHTHAIAINANFVHQALQIGSRARERGYKATTCPHSWVCGLNVIVLPCVNLAVN